LPHALDFVGSATLPTGGDHGGSPYEKPCGMGFTPFNPSYRSVNRGLKEISLTGITGNTEQLALFSL